jgi:hypothetical protein
MMTLDFVFGVETPADCKSGLNLAVSDELSEIKRLTLLRRLTGCSRRRMQFPITLETCSKVDLTTHLRCVNNMLSCQ